MFCAPQELSVHSSEEAIRQQHRQDSAGAEASDRKQFRDQTFVFFKVDHFDEKFG